MIFVGRFNIGGSIMGGGVGILIFCITGGGVAGLCWMGLHSGDSCKGGGFGFRTVGLTKFRIIPLSNGSLCGGGMSGGGILGGGDSFGTSFLVYGSRSGLDSSFLVTGG